MSSAAEQSEDDANREDASFFTFEFVANDEGGIELEQRPRNELDATPLAPNESEEQDATTRKYDDQFDKVLSYEYQYAPPSAERREKGAEETPTSHYDYNFSEKDYKRHRKLSQHHHAPIRPLDGGKHRRRKRKHAVAAQEKQDKELKYPKSPVKLAPIKPLPPLAEHKELTVDELTDKENEQAVWPKGKKDKRKHRHHHRHHDEEDSSHKRHRHHHHHRGITSEDRLELRLRTGLQTLEDEQKAISAITAEIGDASDLMRDEDETLGMKDLEDIKSHRFDDLKGMRRRTVRPRQKSGMPTVLSHADVAEKPTHVQITLPKYKYDHSPREGFVELEELTTGEDNELQWKERARWIKFEEDVEKNERWGKPHVASLSFQSLLELRKGIETGTVLLDLEIYDLPSIFEAIVENMIITDQLSRANKEKVVDILMAKHRHQHQQTRLKRTFSFSSLSSFSLELGRLGDKDSGVETGSGSDGAKVPEQNIDVIPEKDISSNHAPNGGNHDISQTGTTPGTSKSVMFQIGEPEVLGDDEDDHVEGKPFFKEQDNISVSSRASRPSVRFGPVQTESFDDLKKRKQSEVTPRVPTGAEATSVLVGTVPELDQPTAAFVRLAQGCYLGNLTEVTIPVRFIFVLLGPSSAKVEYYEIGRSIATLMADKIFHDLSYAAKTRDDLLSAINSFLDDSIVLAPGDWDRHLLLPLLEAEIATKKRQRKMLMREKSVLDRPPDDQPFLRTGKLFGGLIRDIQRKKRHFKSDFWDGLNHRCLITIIFIFFATLAPTITFGGLLSKKTEDWLGVIETLMATALCGTIFGCFSGQPLIIVGTTGPILVFEQATYMFCKALNVHFLPMRFWIGLWVLLILCIIVAFELCYLVEYFTRFTEEVFSVLISLLFIYEALLFLIDVFDKHPLKPSYNIQVPHNNDTMDNSTLTTLRTQKKSIEPKPNTALLSTMLILGTYFIASYLRKLRHSHFFSSRWRRIVSDFGIPISMVVMVAINFHISNDVYLRKISMPVGNHISPTKHQREGFLFNPFKIAESKDQKGVGHVIGYILLCAVPAFIVSILLFMETELTGVLLNKKKNKLKKGGGYNLDLFLMGVLTGISSVFGLPWMCAATVRSVQHLNALAIMSRSHAPGERPFLVEIKEQRLTNVAIHVLIGCTIFLGEFFRKVPFAVLFGVLLYLGVTSLFANIQFVEQLKLYFMPSKHYPSKRYIYKVPIRKIYFYTSVQLFCLVVLCLIKVVYKYISFTFPVFIIGMVGIRRLLERFFTEEELDELDNEEEVEYDEELDEYDTIYMPI